MNNVSFVGNLLADPELRFGDKPRARFRVAVNEGQGDNEKMHPIDVTAFGTLAENIVESLHKGARVVVVGRFNTYRSDVEIKGEEKSITRTSVTASAVGPDLRWATAKVSKVVKKHDDDDDDDDRGSRGNGRGSERSERSERGSDSRSSRKSERSSKNDDDDDF